MAASDAFRKALVAGDAALLWKMWGTWFPDFPQPQSQGDAEIHLHAARSAAGSIAIRLRCYSHHWLTERGLPSLLPAELLPQAERYTPKVAAGVGFSWGSRSRIMQTAKPEVMKAVGDRIEELAADGILESDPGKVQREMIYAKNRVLHELFGNRTKLLEETNREK